jgi:hypothetical protein
VPAHIHPTPLRFAHEPVSLRGTAPPGSVSSCPPLIETTKCPESLCPIEALPLSARCLCITSEGTTPPSSLLRTHAPDPHPPASSALASSGGSLQVVASPLLDGGPSRRYLCMSFLGCLAPYLGVSSGAFARFFPKDSGLPHAMIRSAFSQIPVQRLQHGAISRGCRHSFMFRPPSLLATQVAPTDTKLPYGRRGVYFRTPVSLLPPSPSDMLTVRIGQLTVGDFHPIRHTALSAVPIAHSVNAENKSDPNVSRMPPGP